MNNEAMQIWKDAADMVGDVLDEYLRRAELAGGKDSGAYRLIFDIIKTLDIEFDYRLRP